MRSATEINANKDIELTGNEANLVAYYKFNDGSGQIATDQSSTTNNAVLGSSNTAYTDDPTWVKVNHAITSVSSYRYGFNGMEKDNSISGTGNSYSTHFRQYDPRLGRWLTLDPKSGIVPYHSPYTAFSNNPVYFIDPRGDIFKVGKNDKQGKKDIEGMQSAESQAANGGAGYVRFGADGTVSLDFGSLQQEQIDEVLKKDEGLSLINNMINAKKGPVKMEMGQNEWDTDITISEEDEYYFYGTEGATGIVPEKPLKGAYNYGKDDVNSLKHKPNQGKKVNGKIVYDPQYFVFNASTTPKGPKLDGTPSYGWKPGDSYDAKIFIGKGTFWIQSMGKFVKVSRSDIVYHELMESYSRTHHKQPYEKAHGNKKISKGSAASHYKP